MSTLLRLNIEISHEEKRKIKTCAALLDMSLRELVLKSIQLFMQQEAEKKDLWRMTQEPTSVLQELWNNEKDRAYDSL
ncbi:MAG: hypothetical protein HY586_00545 [Candidatus Omnitrophica bacterium]|nr:hypothetical protein [Candidatus Omnitrophota bacterium]